MFNTLEKQATSLENSMSQHNDTYDHDDEFREKRIEVKLG